MSPRIILPKIYPITDRSISGLSHIEQLDQLIKGGAEVIQIREKSLTSLEFYEEAANCAAMARAAGIDLIINDRVDIALAVNAAGVHLGQDDLQPNEARRILGNEAIIGYSTHSLGQAEAARSLPIDYIAIGPIFATKTKEDHYPVVGLAEITKVKNAIGNLPLVAIGGIGLNDLAGVIGAGADSVALVSALVGADGIGAKYREVAAAAEKC